MTFAVPEAVPPTGDFTFTVPGREGVFHMTHLAELDLGTVADLASDVGAVSGFIAAGVDEASRDALRSLKGKQAAVLREAWVAASRVTPGESSAS